MGEAMPAGDLKGYRHDLQEVARWLQRPLDAADVEDVQLRGTQGDGPFDRDAVDDPAVHEMLAADLDHREQAGYRRGGDDGVDEAALGEPVLRRPLDARGDALERDGQLLELRHGHEAVKKATQRQVAVEVRTLPDEGAGDAEGGVEDALLAEPAPDGLEAVEHLQGRLGGHEKEKLDGHLSVLRDLEIRLTSTATVAQGCAYPARSNYATPAGLLLFASADSRVRLEKGTRASAPARVIAVGSPAHGLVKRLGRDAASERSCSPDMESLSPHLSCSARGALGVYTIWARSRGASSPKTTTRLLLPRR